MLRVVAPTACCRDPLDEMFGNPWYFHQPRAVPCRRMNSRMGNPTLAAFIDTMEAKESAAEGKKDNMCSCQKQRKKPSDGTTEEKRNHQSSETNQEESPQRCCRTDEQTQSSNSSSPSTSEEPSSEAEKKSEAVSVPIERQDDPDTDHFKVSLNLNSFDPDDIEVKRVDNELKVHAKQEVQRYGMIFHREIHRSFHLPDDVDVESLKSTLSTAGVLTIEAQRKPKEELKDSNDDSQENKEDKVEPTDVKESPHDEASEESTRHEGTNVNELHQEFSFDDPQTESTKEPDEVTDVNQKDGQDQEDE